MSGTNVVASILIGFGIVTVLAGTILIVVAALTAWAVYRRGPASGTMDAAGVDWAKILEALSKVPQWMLAMIAGNAQILIGFWLLGATLFGYKLWP